MAAKRNGISRAVRKIVRESTDVNVQQNKQVLNSLSFNHNPNYYAPIIPVGDIDRLQTTNPQLASEIVFLIKEEQAHRHKLENEAVTLEKEEQALRKEALSAEIKITNKGQNYSLTIATLFIGASLFLTYMGNYWAASVAVGLPVAMIIGAMMGKYKNKNNKPESSMDEDKNY